jgi:hypothetical protein
MQIQQVVVVDRPIRQVFDYVSDFTTVVEWDTGSASCTLVGGDGGEGSTYLKRWARPGRRHGVDVLLTVTECTPDRVFTLHGVGGPVDSRLRFTFRPSSAAGRDGTRVTFTGDYRFRGWVRLLGPVLSRSLRRAGERVQDGLRDALLQLPDQRPPVRDDRASGEDDAAAYAGRTTRD